MSSLTTNPIELPTLADRDEVTRADLVFYDVDHAGASYMGHVFLNRPDANLDTPRDAEHGYAGAFSIFGHGGCFGEDGHCSVSDRTTDEFDLRAQHPLVPQTKTLIVTDPLKPYLLDKACETVTVTVVAQVTGPAGGSERGPVFDLVRLLTYAD
jgi:tyrosinase